MIYRDDIRAQIETELDNLLAGAPESLSEDARKNIKNDLLGYTQHVLDALTTEELQSARAYERFVETTLAEARVRMRRRA